MFKHCSAADIVSFVCEWVATENSEEKERVGCEILDYVSTFSTQFDTRNRFLLKQRRAVLAEKQVLQSGDGTSEFSTKLNSVIENCMKESENEAKCSSLIKPFIDAVDQPQEIPESDSENVVIAIAPNRRLVDFFEGYGGYVDHGEAAFDICIYVPSRRTWYYLTQGSRREVFMKKSSYDAELTQTFVMNSKICFVSPEEHSLFMFDLTDFTWSKVDFEDLIKQNEIRYEPRDVLFVLSRSTQLYLVLRNSSSKDDDELNTFFNCYRLSPLSAWIFMCRTHLMTTQTKDDNKNEFNATISSNGKEMILAYAADKLHVFVIDLKTVQLSDTALCYLTAYIKLS